MNDIILLYILISIIIGWNYFVYWYDKEQPIELRNSKILTRLAIYFLIFILSTLLSPLSLYDLIKYKIQKGEKQ